MAGEPDANGRYPADALRSQVAKFLTEDELATIVQAAGAGVGTGTGGAEKAQVKAMIRVLLPGVKLAGADAADALALAIAHAQIAR